MTPHQKGLLLTGFGGLVLSFDIPVLRLANGGVPLTLFLAWHHLIRLGSATRKP